MCPSSVLCLCRADGHGLPDGSETVLGLRRRDGHGKCLWGRYRSDHGHWTACGGVDSQAKGQTAKLVREFTDRFKAQHQSVNCRDLLGCDLSTPEGRQTAKDKNLYAVCPDIVRDAAKMLNELWSGVAQVPPVDVTPSDPPVCRVPLLVIAPVLHWGKSSHDHKQCRCAAYTFNARLTHIFNARPTHTFHSQWWQYPGGTGMATCC